MIGDSYFDLAFWFMRYLLDVCLQFNPFFCHVKKKVQIANLPRSHLCLSSCLYFESDHKEIMYAMVRFPDMG